MKIETEKLPRSQLKITVTLENTKVKEMYGKVLEDAIKETDIEGFRKGSAPKEKVEQKLGVSKLHGNTINELLQKYYSQVLKENHIFPISNPKVEVKEFDMNKDFEFVATVAIKPEITLKDYKKALKKYYEDKNEQTKKENAERLKKGEKISHDHAHLHTNEIVDLLTKTAELEVPDILVEEETNRLIARLVDQVLATGMKVEDYLKAQNSNMEELKTNYKKIADQNIRAELVLNELISLEKIKIGDEEVEKAIQEVQDEKAREQLNNPVQKVYIKTVLEKNKLIESLIKETQGEHHHE